MDTRRKRNEDEVIDLKKTFSSLGKFFSSKGSKHETHIPTDESTSEDLEDSTDIKSSNSTHHEKPHNHSRRSKSPINEYSDLFKKMLPFILVVGIFLFSVILRSTSANLPITETWAQDSLNAQIKSQISASAAKQYPNLAPADRNTLINQEFLKYVESNKGQYQNQLNQLTDYYKSRFQNDDGQTYLVAIDPYHWFRLARNVVEKGHVGDVVVNGEQRDALRLAPFGDRAKPEAHIFVIAYFHKFLRLFNKNQDLMTSAFYVPVILASLAIIPAFFLAKKHAGNLGGFVAGVIVAVHPSFLSRTMGGFADTDSYNVLMPLLIIWFFVEAFESKNLKKGIAFLALSVASMVAYSVLWSGWWYIFAFLVAAIGLYLAWLIVLKLFKQRKTIGAFIKDKVVRKDVAFISIFLITVFIVMSFLNGSSFIQGLFGRAQFVINLKEVAQETIWPNVFTTVAELNPANNSQMITSIGGKTVFIFSFIGLLLTLLVKGKGSTMKESLYVGASFLYYLILLNTPNKYSSVLFAILMGLPVLGKLLFNLLVYTKAELEDPLDIKYTLILLVWCLGTIYGASKGVRFIMLLMPAFSIGIAIFSGQLFKLLSKISEQALHISKQIVTPVLAILISFLILATPIGGELVKGGLSVAKNEVPSMNDAWFGALRQIRDNSNDDAIIASWWDFGHWFKAIGERGVFFDGASQDTPNAHWMGKSLLATNELETLGILRYMACGQNRAYDALVKDAGLDQVYAMGIITDIQTMNSVDARVRLSTENLSDSVVEDVMKYSHCVPPEVFYITSEDMVGKGGVWGHFGSWNFERAKMYNMVHNLGFTEGVQTLETEFEKSPEDAQKLYQEIISQDPNQWISGWPGFYSGGTLCSKRNDDIHLCDISVQGGKIRLILNETSMNLGMIVSDTEIATVGSYSYVDNGSLVVKSVQDSPVPYSFIVIKEGNTFRVVLTDKLQVESTFTKLFFFEGVGMKYIKKFVDNRGIIGGRILVWKIDWESYLADLNDLPDDYVYKEDSTTEEDGFEISNEKIIQNITG